MKTVNHEIETLVKKHTAFESLSDMANAGGNYRPTLRTKTGRTSTERAELSTIAFAYNAYQIERGDPRRASES